MDSARQAVRRHVRAEREQHGWSQSDLAAAAGVSRGTVANLENGQRLTEGKESKIEKALNKPLGWLDRLRHQTETDETDAEQPAPPDRDALRARLDAYIGRLERLQHEIDETFAEGDELRGLLGDAGDGLRTIG